MKLTKDDYHASDKWIYFTQQEFDEILKNQEKAEKWNKYADNKEIFRLERLVERLKKRIQEVEKEGTIRDLKFYNELQNILGDKNE